MMRVLALETSSRYGSVAVLEGDRLLGESSCDPSQRTAQSFAPTIQQQLAAVGWAAQDVQLVAVTIGPGSFTGLRIGVTAAKTFAYAVGAEVMGVSTLEVIARQIPGDSHLICSVLDAQRQQVFAANFQQQENALKAIGDPQIMDNDDWLNSLVAGTVVAGPGLRRLHPQLPNGVTAAERHAWAPRASTVGLLAGLEYRSGKRDDLWKLNPLYYRRSAAEEKLEAEE
jgi:tRNA threonylcarbamoyladenosine biosynthesis protein TsaB